MALVGKAYLTELQLTFFHVFQNGVSVVVINSFEMSSDELEPRVEGATKREGAQRVVNAIN